MRLEKELSRIEFLYVATMSAIALIAFVLSLPASFSVIPYLFLGLLPFVIAVIRSKSWNEMGPNYVSIIFYTVGGAVLLYLSLFMLVLASNIR